MVTRYEWGVDSARVANEDLLQCVLDNFGFPRYWALFTAASQLFGRVDDGRNQFHQRQRH